jgi:hypothetical protein
MPKKPEKQTNYTYMDLLTEAITNHERKLNEIIIRLNQVVNELSGMTNQESSQRTKQQPVEDDEPKEDLSALLKTAHDML